MDQQKDTARSKKDLTTGIQSLKNKNTRNKMAKLHTKVVHALQGNKP